VWERGCHRMCDLVVLDIKKSVSKRSLKVLLTHILCPPPSPFSFPPAHAQPLSSNVLLSSGNRRARFSCVVCGAGCPHSSEGRKNYSHSTYSRSLVLSRLQEGLPLYLPLHCVPSLDNAMNPTYDTLQVDMSCNLTPPLLPHFLFTIKYS